MSGVNQYLKEEFAKMKGKVWLTPDIPEKKLSNAVNAFKYNGDPSTIIAILDNTTLRSAKEGFIVSGSKLVCKEVFESPIELLFEDIESFEYIENITQNSKGKEKKSSFLKVNKKDGSAHDFKYNALVDTEALARILNDALKGFENYEEQSQLEPIENLSEELKLAYLKVIVNMAFDDDGEVDENEFSEILQLITRLNLKPESRNEVRLYIATPEDVLSTEELVNILNKHSPDGMQQSLHVSLVKDLLSIHSSLTQGQAKEFEFLQKNKKLFSIGDQEIELAQMAIENDRKILDRKYDDKAIARSVKELSAKAGAIGVPLGAVYLSGSVMGLSAAGMTSGLATLGMGGVLGLSSMATGIGAAVILGVVAYKGIRHLSNTGVEEGDKRREIMLQEVIRQSQKTISMVIEDINLLTKELSEALASEHVTKERLDQLGQKFKQYVQATKLINNKAEKAEVHKARLKSPEILDVNRLRALTKEHDKKRYFDLVMSFYQEVTIKEENSDGQIEEKTVWKMIGCDNTRELEELGGVFEMLGYSSTQSAIKGKLQGFMS
ncbi:hypothetical protein B0H98_10296 [Vreelandella songnenensis]|uniref:Uncharacterized protein n=1 Tax=Vreelandella songnenensis TaxID=1176243 RepID=A0A2T0V5W2_9GAMM|nr:hypothetical protein [Halomonas songnenensis]PRY65572.1 hypothetical protein B0H98_10296 [Halomonas songnenensis]